MRHMTRSLLLLLLIGALPSCAGEVIPEEFSRGRAIPFGSHTVTVFRVQPNQLGDALILSVHLRIDPKGGGDAPLDKKWVDYLRKVKLTDGTGKQHRAVGVMPAAIQHAQQRIMASGDPDAYARIVLEQGRKLEEMYSSGNLPLEWDEWILVYNVPKNAKPFTLYLKNPDQKDDQPRAAIVRVYR